ncbi:unnamed protein product [Anisakis simplex]|uniref:Gag-pol polyprotein n=1 Tax=Anisakis simplex TaxID=6269 RepID=A0A0M3KA38_ANISI|nr:unnamed protein product [Anisakis simplex]
MPLPQCNEENINIPTAHSCETYVRGYIIALGRVKQMGNLDQMINAHKATTAKEIEGMGSKHEMELNSTPPNKSTSQKHARSKHVQIIENRCQLFETNNEGTLDEEADDAIAAGGH